MKLLLSIIILAAGFVEKTVATIRSDAVVLRGKSTKGVVSLRVLKAKSAKSNCPLPTSYDSPKRCSESCYSDIETVFKEINISIAKGTPFDGTICKGTYTLPYDTYVNGETEGSDVALRCCGSKNSCIVDGGGPNNAREKSVFLFESTVQQFILEGITFQNFQTLVIEAKKAAVVTIKHASFDSVVSTYGAFMFHIGSLVTIEGCIVTNCSAGNLGGALYAFSSKLLLNGNTFNGNSAQNWGGALFFHSSSGDVKCNRFELNNAQQNGGAIYVTSSKLNLSNNDFFGNNAHGDWGGAVLLDNSSGDVKSNLFQYNSAQNVGGGIYSFFSDVQLSDNQFQGNIAGSNGGAVFAAYNTMSSLSNTYTSNYAGFGGAIYANYAVFKSASDTFDLNSASVSQWKDLFPFFIV